MSGRTLSARVMASPAADACETSRPASDSMVPRISARSASSSTSSTEAPVLVSVTRLATVRTSRSSLTGLTNQPSVDPATDASASGPSPEMTTTGVSQASGAARMACST